MTPEDALNDNESYRVVWQILKALRSHDDRFDAMINKLDLGVRIRRPIEIIAVTNKLPTRTETKKRHRSDIGRGERREMTTGDAAHATGPAASKLPSSLTSLQGDHGHDRQEVRRRGLLGGLGSRHCPNRPDHINRITAS